MGLETIISETATYEHNGATIPMRDHPAFKDIPDVDTLGKRFLDTHTYVGRSVALPKETSTPEEVAKWRSEHLPKFVKAGLIPTPPQTPGAPDKYEVKYQNEQLTKLVSPELVSAVQEVAHKHGLTQEALADLTALNEQQFAGVFQVIQVNEEKTRESVMGLSKEFNKPPEQLTAMADNWLSKNGYSEDQVQALKTAGALLDAPFLDLIIRAAVHSGASEGLLGEMGGAAGANDDGSRMLAEISDPKHPEHKAYIAEQGKGPINDRLNAAFAKKGGGEFVISG